MILGIDASQANRKVRSGTEWYAFNLINEFKKLLRDRRDVEVVLYLRDAPQADLAADLPSNFKFKILRWPLPYFWGQGRLSLEMLFHPPDVLFCPAHTIPLIHPYPLSVSPFPEGRGRRGEEEANFSPMRRGRLRGGRTYTTLHDIGFEDNPELYDKLSLWYHRWSAKFAVKHAAHIFTISEFSKKRIVEVYHAQPEKISVIYLGSDLSRPLGTLPTPGEGLNGKYLLFVGRLEPKKNIMGMVKGYEKVLRLSASGRIAQDKFVPNLIFAGRPVRIQDVRDYLAQRPALRNKIKFIGYIDQRDLPALYAGAAIFLFPTFYEGFGLPILEAQSCGTPVITSNITSNPEIAGEGAVIVDPRNTDEIANAIEKLIEDGELRNQIVQKGFENVKRFSWEKTARETLDKLLSS